jgi:predicted DNA-binding transcriptional regulator AlpA
MKLLTVSDLADILGRSPTTIRAGIHRNPASLPPPLNIPGSRLLRWRREDVERWLATLCTETRGSWK